MKFPKLTKKKVIYTAVGIVVLFGALRVVNNKNDQKDNKPNYTIQKVSHMSSFSTTGSIQAQRMQVLDIPEGKVQWISVMSGEYVYPGQALVSVYNKDDELNKYKTVTAPFAGVVDIDDSKQGHPVITLYSNELQATAGISEYDYAKVPVGKEIKVEALATHKEDTTTVKSLAQYPMTEKNSKNNTKYKMTADVNMDNFMNGQTVKITVQQDGMVIPSTAVKNKTVYRVKHGKAYKQKVEGYANNGQFVIQSGLNEGQKVVINPDKHLKSGDHID